MSSWRNPRATLVAPAALAAGLVLGAIVLARDSSSGEPASNGATIERVSFQADAGVEDEPILDLGGLTLRASCQDYGARAGTQLAVTAETAFDDSVIAASFAQRKGQDQSADEFGLSDFEPSYGAWDFLGKNPNDTVGTMSFSRPDGGQVTVTFIADQRTAQGDCLFGGTAVFAP